MVNLSWKKRLMLGVVMTPFYAMVQRLPPGFNKREGLTMSDFVWMLP